MGDLGGDRCTHQRRPRFITSHGVVSLVIEYCQSNVDDETRAQLRGLPSATEAACLGRCGRCYRDAFLVIDGEFRRGASHQALLEAREDRSRRESVAGRVGAEGRAAAERAVERDR